MTNNPTGFLMIPIPEGLDIGALFRALATHVAPAVAQTEKVETPAVKVPKFGEKIAARDFNVPAASMLLGRQTEALRRVNRMVTRVSNKAPNWSEAEMNQLIALWPTTPKSKGRDRIGRAQIIAGILGRTPAAVQQRASKLGLSAR